MTCKFRGMMTMMMLMGCAARQDCGVGPGDSGDSPRRTAVSRGRSRRRLLSVLTALIAAGMVTTACSRSIAGTPSAAEDGSVAPAELPAYEPPADGSGFATQPMDQAFPLPSWFWSGRQDICDGITAEVVVQAGGVTRAPNAAGCNIKFGGGTEVVQVSLVGPYMWLTDPAQFVRPVTIAGLEGRERALSGQGAGECTVEVNTRSPLSLMAVAWNPADPNGGDRELRCAKARKVVEAIVTRYVPAAGGTPWPATPQVPPADASAGMTACEIVDDSAAVYGATSPKSAQPGTEPLGTTCTYSSTSTELEGFVTDGTSTGLDDIEPRVPNAEVTNRTLATLPARQENAGSTCALLVEFTPGRVFGITYNVDVDGAACKFAEVVAATVLSDLVDQTPG